MVEREASKYKLLRGLFTHPVSVFRFSGDSYIGGELFLVREAVSDFQLAHEFVQVLFDVDLVGSYVLDDLQWHHALEDPQWRLTDVKTDGELASMQCTGAATVAGEPVDMMRAKALILHADLSELIADKKRSFFETRTLNDDDADLDNCKFVSIYTTAHCVLIARTSMLQNKLL
jgi:hypothetical protein